MTNPCYPLTRGETYDDPDNIAFYGDDNEYSPFKDSDNNVQVFLPNISDRNAELITRLQTHVNLLQDPTSFGMDVW